MKSLWNNREASKARDALGLLVYSSRLIGSEPKLCVWGGGNTSTKTIEKDHCGYKRHVLRIKGSGSDLKTSTRRDYPPVDLEELRHAYKFKNMSDDEMVDYVARCVLEPKAPRPSIEVLLHAFVDKKDIHHTHADAILAITNTKNGRKIAQKVFGDDLLWVPYIKPGFTLAKKVGEVYLKNSSAQGLILEKHGLITWGDDAKTSYQRTIAMVTRAERFLARQRKRRKNWSPTIVKLKSGKDRKKWLLRFLPVIRASLSARERVVLKVNDSPGVFEFINARDASKVSQAGPATPDHMLRTKRRPLFVKIPGGDADRLTDESLRRQIQNYAQAHKRYFQRHKQMLAGQIKNGSVQMLDPYPKVILVPGIGMITSGRDEKSAKIVSEIYDHSISVMVHASCIDQYESLSERLAFEMDYWPMELYKLSLLPPEAEFSRRVGLVTGAARGIGKAIAEKIARSGGYVFLADLEAKAVEQASDQINARVGRKLAFPLAMDVTSDKSVRQAIEQIVLRLGGLDFLVSNAGIAHVAAIDKLRQNDWDKSLSVNATGHFLVAREIVRLMKRQGLGGACIFIASKNVLAPGKDFGAYSAAKAAESQLARILAIENGEHGIRVNLINPDGVFEGSGLWHGIRKNRARTYGIPAKKLEDYYTARNLMKTRVLPEDVAEATAFLLSSRSAKTTGCILTVDGGVKEAFPR